jgi:hypothetical protein
LFEAPIFCSAILTRTFCSRFYQLQALAADPRQPRPPWAVENDINQMCSWCV